MFDRTMKVLACVLACLCARVAWGEGSTLPSSQPVYAAVIAEKTLREIKQDSDLLRERLAVAADDATLWLGAPEAARQADAELAQRVANAEVGAPRTDVLYDELVQRAIRARDALSERLEQNVNTPQQVAVDRTNEEPEFRSQIDAALETRAGLAQSVQRALATSYRLELDVLAGNAQKLNQLRLGLLPKLSNDKRSAVLGLGTEGIAQASREVRQVGLVARYYLRTEVPSLRDQALKLTGADIAVILVQIGGAFLLLAVARYVARRGRTAVRLLLQNLSHVVRRRAALRVASTATRALLSIWPQLVTLLALVIANYAFASTLAHPAASLAFAVLFSYAVYRLCVQGVFGLLAETGPVREARDEKILRSIVLVGRVLFGLYIYLFICELVLGRGYLYQLAARFGGLLSVPVLFVLIRWWRNDVADAYLKTRSDSALRRLVESSRPKWYGFFIAIAAFVVLLVETAFKLAKAFALSFDKSRKALAYLFRRRLEKAARKEEDGQDAPLPEEFLRQLRAPSQLICSPNETAAFSKAHAQWTTKGGIGAWLVTGRRGVGKTTWVNTALADIPHRAIYLTERVTSPAQLLSMFAVELGSATADEAGVTATLIGIDREVIVVDGLERLFLRCVGQRAVWETLFRLIENTGHRVFWLCTMREPSYAILRWTLGQRAFRHVETIAPWTEDKIAELLQQRVQLAGYAVDYDALISADRIDRGPEALKETATEYSRLIWDYADGNAEAALWFWRKSLAPSARAKQLQVALFRHPDEEALSSIPESQKLLLAAIVTHGPIKLSDAAKAVRLPLEVLRDAMAQLMDLGVIERSEAPDVTLDWAPVVERYVRRKHLVHD